MVTKYDIENNKVVQKDDGSVWVYTNLTEQEKSYLVNELLVDEHTLNSSLDADELSRLEFEPGHTAMIFKCPKHYSAKEFFKFRAISIGVFLFKDKLIIISADGIDLFYGKPFQKVTSRTDLLFKMMFQFIIQFNEHLKVINKISDESEHRINTAMENKYLMSLFTLEKSLVYYLNAIHSNGILIDKLKFNINKFDLNIEDTELLDDIIIENNQCGRQAEIYSNILAGLMDARVSIVSNNLNILMKTLNIITICIMVPTFVVSAFSMNVNIPFQGSPYAFWIVMGFSMTAMLGFLVLWRVKKW